MTGMESMFLTLMKAMGFNPQEVVKQVTDFASSLQSTLAQVDAKFTRVEIKVDKILDRFDAVFPQVPLPSCEVDETLSAVVVPISVTLEHKEAA